MDDIAIKVEHVSKSFRLPHEKQSSIKSALINLNKRGYETQKVLDDVSFEVKKGEFFGIVGRNGSGKSTLLKLLAGIYSPSKGSIQINGKLTPFIELGVGFNPELTGRENVFLNGALLGFDRKEMLAMYDEIVEFAELERFMDQKLKNYSSGMQVRLAFSIAIRINSDILVLDEVLAVGDVAFQKKCFDYFMKLKRAKQTVILVTHDMTAVRLYCDAGIMIEKGKIVKAGGIENVAQAYQKIFNDEIRGTSPPVEGDDQRWGTAKIKANAPQIEINGGEINIATSYKVFEDVDSAVFGFTIYNSRGINILEGNTLRKNKPIDNLLKGTTVSMTWTLPNILATDSYSVSIAVCNQTATEFYDWYNDAGKFEVHKEGDTAGLVDPDLTLHKVAYSKEEKA